MQHDSLEEVCERPGRITCDPRIMKKKKKGCLILNSNTWRITDRLVLFLLCQVTLLACTGQRLVGRGSDKTLCKIHCFSMQRVSHDK